MKGDMRCSVIENFDLPLQGLDHGLGIKGKY